MSQENDELLTMSFVGDILLDTAYLADSDDPFQNIKKELKNSDITAGNLECPVSYNGYPNSGKDPEAVDAGREFIFRATPEMGKSLSAAGFDLVTLANNRSLDYGDPAILDTLEFLRENNIKYVGAGQDIYEATTPVYIEKKGVKVAFLGFSEIVPAGYNATESYPGIAVARMDYGGATFDEYIKEGSENSDITVVLIHWGAEGTHDADSWQKELAHQAVDMGADLVIGSHPHVLQGIEKYKDSVIVYSLGNFVFDSWAEASRETVIFKCSYKGTKLAGIELIPVYINNGKPEPATGDRKSYILDLMKYLSLELGYVL